eukprot:Protomagalhaensia_sp_Gyna_25__979@NODE_1474_length_1805_cov_28_857305_g1038_i1_p1_GENE_NODE_1474_length_1805_cov_28_857305_g1038_i1NODE_1474_length_1805_cov_28_857305_g1038_i1_p1_ORF_typecomplete_len131_score6_62rve/PF00665_26/1_9e09Integrase_H2C2/PF17921_1/2_7e05rve_3/PF13683_6/1e04rve_3/PF13683_6/0_075BaffRTall_bind/PF09256_10/0_28_NODE_1474_length_1805_cov_28_857305_g1038_i1544936
MWWPGINKDLEDWVRGCVGCSMLRSGPTGPYNMGSLSRAGVGELLSLDYIGHRNEKWIPLMGVPARVLSDRGTQFNSSEFETFITGTLGAEMVYSLPGYPQGNGLNESSHRILEHALKAWNGPYLTAWGW